MKNENLKISHNQIDKGPTLHEAFQMTIRGSVVGMPGVFQTYGGSRIIDLMYKLVFGGRILKGTSKNN